MELSLRECAGQVLVAGFPGTTPPRALLSAINQGELGGVILFKRNLGAPADVSDLIARFAAHTPIELPALIGIDQEGGRVARLGPPILSLPPMRTLGEHGDAALTRESGRVLGNQLKALGFTMNFAPVLDVDSNPDNPVIGDRAFGSDPATVVTHARAFAEGLEDAGIISCGKHFPGHGDTDLDSHLALPTIAHDRSRLEEIELVPFRQLSSFLPAIMTAHVVFSDLDPEVPATLSRQVITDLLRKDMGYHGLIISDDLEMKAVCERWGIVGSAVSAIEAGCDLLLVCSDVDSCLEAREALLRRAESKPEFAERLHDAAQRVVALKRRHPPTPSRDSHALRQIWENDESRTLQGRLDALMS